MIYNGKGFSKVVCLVKTTTSTEVATLDDFMISSFHPIKYFTKEWIHPKYNFQFLENVSNIDLYNLVLEDTHVAYVENIECITLGHGVQDDSVATHDYYGTNKVIDDLKAIRGFDDGFVTHVK